MEIAGYTRRGEYRMITKADVTDDDLASVKADAKLDRLL